MRRQLAAVVAGLVAVAGGVVALPGPAMAGLDEFNQAVASSAPTGTYKCTVAIAGATACFKPYGDIWYVKDTAADSASAQVAWYMSIGSASEHYTRAGTCRNSLGNGTWGACNLEYAETEWLDFAAVVWDVDGGGYVRESPMVYGVKAG
ncbi:hypothetical protein ACQP2E_16665 [Actinoplanes sp. CA-015351]|uniref:hypothetical protein n=1 Tax=Actinoplanes sp. CA-015351 TaxID=3239897 RepID=UPI003D98CDA5